MNSPVQLYVSVDVGCHEHSVAIGLSSGEVLQEFNIAHKSSGFEQFFASIEQYCPSDNMAVTVAMEGYNGHARPLDQMVQFQGYQLLNLNNMKLSRFKEIFPATAKTDRIDARKGLELMQSASVLSVARNALQRVVVAPIENDQLKRLTRRRRALVNEKTRVLNRMQSDLQAVSPGLLQISADAENLWFLNTLISVDELSKLSRVRKGTLLKIRGVGRLYAQKICQWQSESVFGRDVDWVGPMILEDARRILALRVKIKALQDQCTKLMATSRIGRLIETIPGFGVICASTLAGEIGTVERFRNDGSLAMYMGMAPLDRSSGATKGTRTSVHVNRYAKAAMMTGVDRHRKQVPESQIYYEKKRAQGKSHNQAIRSLGRHLCRVIFNMLRHDRAYISTS